MKGTIQRGRTIDEDEIQRSKLHDSPKDRAENLMIADLMRNDLGQITNSGTVEVTRLFDVDYQRTTAEESLLVSTPRGAFPERLCSRNTETRRYSMDQPTGVLTARGLLRCAGLFLAKRDRVQRAYPYSRP